MPAASLLNDDHDDDTLGGRIVRARAAAGIDGGDLARNIGVKKSTLDAWEADRAEPRSNKLSMLAGLLGVSPTWLLSGLGASPNTETIADEIRLIRGQLDQLRELRSQTDVVIDNMERALAKIAARDEG